MNYGISDLDALAMWFETSSAFYSLHLRTGTGFTLP